MTEFPKTTRFSPEEERGRDFMGQQATIQALTGDCLPSFTNSTAKLRYYSFWAWAFKMLGKNYSNIEEARHKQYLWKLETAMNIANRLRDPDYTGMPGVNGITFPDADAADDLEVVIDVDTDYRTSAYSPVQYAPSLGTLSVLQRQGKEYTLLKYGIRLADIFDSTIKTYDGYCNLIDPTAKTLTMGQLRNLMPALSLDNVSRAEKECFLEIIEQDEVKSGSENGMTPRIQTTRMLLDIMRTQDVRTTQDTVTPIWNGTYQSPNALKSITDAWRIIRARQFFQLSVEAYLSAFSLFIEGQPSKTGDLTQFKDMIIDRLDQGEILGHKLTGIESFLKDAKTFGELCNFLYDFCTANHIDEDSIMEAIESRPVKRSGAYQIHLSAELGILGLLLHTLLHKRVQTFQEGADKKSQKFLSYPQGYRLSFNTFKELFESCLKRDLNGGLERLLSETMLKLHLGVAQDKWLQTGNFTFRFVRADDGGYMRQHESGINNPNATGNKLWAYISILRYIGFWDYGDDMQMILTQDGLDYLAQTVPLND